MSGDDHDDTDELEEMNHREGLIFVDLDELLKVGYYGERRCPHF